MAENVHHLDEHQRAEKLQLDVSWFVMLPTASGIASGGAFCFHPEGYLLTALHVVEGNVRENPRDVVLVRNYNDNNFRRAEIKRKFPDSDIAILKIANKPNETFTYMSIPSQVKLKFGDELVSHGHSGGLPFSTYHVYARYKFDCNENLSPYFRGKRNFSGTSEKVLKDLRASLPPASYRTFAYVWREERSKDSDSLLIKWYNKRNPYLPLIEHDRLEGGFSGCPLFKTTGELAGVAILSLSDRSYSVPVDLLYYLVHNRTTLFD